MITWQRALSDDGSLKNISDVTDAYRKVHNFTCFGCNNELTAVFGKKLINDLETKDKELDILLPFTIIKCNIKSIEVSNVFNMYAKGMLK